MDRRCLEEFFAAIKTTCVAVIGDFCLDAYWTLDSAGSEVSVETGKRTQAVRAQRYSLGGAGNVVTNLVDLGVGQVHALGVIGDDLFGRELKTLLGMIGANVDGVCVQANQWSTPVYGKPYIAGEEQSRIDFGVFNRIEAETERRLIEDLQTALGDVQAVIVNQQLPRGIHSATLIDGVNRLAVEHPEQVFIVDSRHQSDRFHGMALKLNDVAAGRLVGMNWQIGDLVPVDEAHTCARELFARTGRPVFITRSARGLVAYDGREMTDVPGIQVLTPVDPAGAGDAAVAAIAAALAVGTTVGAAAELANIAAAVTVGKVGQCGTATATEIVKLGVDADYVHRPELAEDRRAARYHGDTEIELISPELPPGRIRHALFDHDGTLSTLRQGWEAIMEPMMVKAILGPGYFAADETTYRKVADAVRAYIDQSTGLQTIAQMEALVEMVRRFGCVPPEQVLDKSAYKALFNAALLELVRARLAKLRRGELDVSDCTIKGAIAFLHRLRERGVTLYLASGTDRDDVIAEAEALGYAALFEGRIYGAVDNAGPDTKKVVVDRILRENDLAGAQLVCFGDGPVELRETKKRSGIAVGIASDEVRRHGLSWSKRARLVRAGADVIVPDFSQGPALLDFLFAVSC